MIPVDQELSHLNTLTKYQYSIEISIFDTQRKAHDSVYLAPWMCSMGPCRGKHDSPIISDSLVYGEHSRCMMFSFQRNYYDLLEF